MSEEKQEVTPTSEVSEQTSTEVASATASSAESSVASVAPEVLPKKGKPITVKGGEKTVPKDPKGKFDYSNCKTYEVKEGDTLLDVAQKFVVSIQQLRYFNHINKLTWKIHKGQTLYIPDKPVYVPAGE